MHVSAIELEISVNESVIAAKTTNSVRMDGAVLFIFVLNIARVEKMLNTWKNKRSSQSTGVFGGCR